MSFECKVCFDLNWAKLFSIFFVHSTSSLVFFLSLSLSIPQSPLSRLSLESAGTFFHSLFTRFCTFLLFLPLSPWPSASAGRRLLSNSCPLPLNRLLFFSFYFAINNLWLFCFLCFLCRRRRPAGLAKERERLLHCTTFSLGLQLSTSLLDVLIICFYWRVRKREKE